MPTFTNNTKPGNENAIVGVADLGIGVHGTSTTSTGTGGVSGSGIGVHGVSTTGPGVRGDCDNGVGVFGGSKTSSGVGGMTDSGFGVHGISKTGVGVRGHCEGFQGVYGSSIENAGVVGESTKLHGVFGICHNPNGGGIYGTNDMGGHGVEGFGQPGRGVWGHSATSEGVLGTSDEKAGVIGTSVNNEGVRAETNSKNMSALAAYQKDPLSDGAALYAEHADQNRTAAFFKGNLVVTGYIQLANADCAEDFDISAESSAEPGTVMVLNDEGKLRESFQPYDKRVAGVVSGAGSFKPGLVLDKQPSQGNRRPIALIGKTFCKVDAQFGPIGVGDLLTTSPTPGHAMRVDDPFKAFGAVIGKALRPVKSGQDLVPILIALQ
jgi:hypothetical protein